MSQSWVTGEVRNYFEINEKWKHSVPKLIGYSKTVLRGKFIAINAYIKKDPKSSNLTLYLTDQEKSACAKASKIEEIMIRAEINEIGSEKLVSVKTKVVSLKRSNSQMFS